MFYLPKPFAEWDFANMVDGPYLADMLVPLTSEEARARWTQFGEGKAIELLLDGKQPEDMEGHLHTCRHWDTETRLCKAYDSRPLMCSEYPYAAECRYCGLRSPAEVRAKYVSYDTNVWAWRSEAEAYEYLPEGEPDLPDDWTWDPATRLVHHKEVA